ncbi:MAG: hypothetical protein IJQ48_02265 [Prevotella sp.]|nr:hypothetical protein [Prevotella sp.]
MGLFDKLKDQALNSINELAGIQKQEVDNEQYQQTTTVPPPSPQGPVVQSPSTQAVRKDQENGIYGNYLENLIDMALADGELTEKEKQILFKKAEANGIDLDEFEMVLDARLYEKQKAMQLESPNPHNSAPKSEKYGDVRKCPSCGAILESFITRCPDCGYEIRNIGTTSSFTLLSAKLEAIENQKKGGFWSSLKDDSLDKRKISLIDGFPIPTAKEDILEFISMATPLAKLATKKKFLVQDQQAYAISTAWKKKCEQVIMKARFSMKDDKALLEEIERYAIELKIK